MIDPLYLFARYLEWEQNEEPSAAWDLLSAARSSHADTRAHARNLLATSAHFGGDGLAPTYRCKKTLSPSETIDMTSPYGLDIVDDCTACASLAHAFCAFSDPVRESLTKVGHKTVLPAGAILFVEGQAPRGMFIICSGKVNLSTTSREGKLLVLRTAQPGEALGISAAITATNYQMTAETATPCQVDFVDTKNLLHLLESHIEVGVHTARCLSRDFQTAYREIHGLILTRTSAGRLARLLLSQTPEHDFSDSPEIRVPSTMTHEEMAHRIGASRETVTRLLSRLKRKRLIRQDGSTLVIRDPAALEALAV